MNKFQIATIKRVAQSVSIIAKKIESTKKQMESMTNKIEANKTKIEDLNKQIALLTIDIQGANDHIALMEEEINNMELSNVRNYGKTSMELCYLDEKGHWQIKEEQSIFDEETAMTNEDQSESTNQEENED